MVGRATPRGARRGAGASASRERPQAESSNSSTTQTAESTPTATGSPASTRGGTSAGRATKGPAAGRFRPKNVRRAEAERDTIAREEEKKANERAAEERRARGRSRFRSKRSRGDAMGARGGAMGRTITTASGPFASAQGGTGRGGGGFFNVGGGGSGIGGGRGIGGGGGFGGRGVKSESGGAGFNQIDGGHYREARINADKLHGLVPEDDLDSEDEAMLAALSSRSQTTLPMGIQRKEHKEAELVVATTAELEAAENNTTVVEESLFVDSGTNTPPEQQDTAEEGVWGEGQTTAGASASASAAETKPDVTVKAEPTDDVMDLDSVVPGADEQDKEKKKPVVKVKKTLPLQDPEDGVIQDDLDLLAKELGAVTVEKDGETVTEPANKDGRLYLFQFPPLMPPLKPSEASATPKVKQEGDAGANSNNDNGAVDLTTAEDQDDSDDEDDEITAMEKAEQQEREQKDGFRSQLLSQGGMIGRVNVRKSGKVELSWGGRVLEMSPAAGMNFLTTAVIVEESDEKPTNGPAGAPPTGGDCVGMGKIMGRFTLAPVWTEEEEWVVDPEELNVT